jgi:hypothetical protein
LCAVLCGCETLYLELGEEKEIEHWFSSLSGRDKCVTTAGFILASNKNGEP